MALTPGQQAAIDRVNSLDSLSPKQRASFERVSKLKDEKQGIRPELIESRARIAPMMPAVYAKTLAESVASIPSNLMSGKAAEYAEENPVTTLAMPWAAMMDFKEPFVEGLQQAAEFTGADLSIQPQNIKEHFAAGATSAVLDPASYIGTPMPWAEMTYFKEPFVKGLQQAALKTLPALGRATGISGMGGMSEVGGELGSELEQKLTGEDTGTGRIIGGLTPAVAGIPATAGLKSTLQSGYSAWSNWNSTHTLQKGIPVAQRGVLKDIAKTQGIENIDSVFDEFTSIAHKLDKEQLPLFVAMSENPVVAKYMVSLAKKDPTFRGRIENELAVLKESVEQQSTKMFGTRYPDLRKPSEILAPMRAKLKPIKERITHLTDRIGKLSDRLDTGAGKTEIGEKIATLVEGRRKLVSAEMSPQYDAIKSDAKAAGATLPPDGTREIYQFVKQNKLEDLFGRGTKLDKLISQYFSPTTSKVPVEAPIGLNDIMMGKIPSKATRSVSQYPEVSFSNIDSLKRRINELKRKPMSRTERRQLEQLESVVKDARTKIPGDFNQRLIDTDAEFYQRLGVPFSQQGIVEIGAKKYFEEVAPVLLKNKSALQGFLNVSDDQGKVIARNTVIADLYDKVTTNGSLDAKALNKYIHRKREIIDEIPGLRNELTGIVDDHSRLFAAKGRLDSAYKQQQDKIGKHFLSQAGDIAGIDYDKMVRDLFSDKSKLDDLFSDLGMIDKESSKAVKQALRAELVHFADTKPGGAYAFMTDVKNRSTVGKIMGTGYQHSVNGMMKVMDAIREAGLDNLQIIASKEARSQIFGVDFSYLTSQARDRISSTVMKVFRVASKSHDARRGGKLDDTMMELFTDPEGMMKLKQTADALKIHGFTPDQRITKLLADGVNTMGEILPSYVYTGAKPVPEIEETR
jgi:hypothetical protein